MCYVEASMGAIGETPRQRVWQSVTLYQAVPVTQYVVDAEEAILPR